MARKNRVGSNQYTTQGLGLHQDAAAAPDLVVQASDDPNQLSDDDIDRVFVALFGFPARSADKMILQQMGRDRDTLANFVWDHWLGEPDEPSEQRVRQDIEEILGRRSEQDPGSTV
jgi:hypothetical protein